MPQRILSKDVRHLLRLLTGLVLRKTFVFTQVVPEVTTVHMIDHKVQIFPILKCTMHIDKETKTSVTTSLD
jgi:hypothetical protein